ncbi:hypothetical protein Taro_032936 [Colocasia esculenta]|uniref:Uncharacterized protein n=1 Tax=Colocasia esculenta TaxID=4460 RepID=A0A843WAY2_COLES|nr:hypothetical protein [Colocasia esculenta]
MAEYENVGYQEDIYDEMYDSMEPLPQLPNAPHARPSTSHVHAVDTQSPHLSPRHVTRNASTSIDLSQLVDLLQNLQPSQLQEVQTALKGKSIPKSIQSLHSNAGVFYEPTHDLTPHFIAGALEDEERGLRTRSKERKGLKQGDESDGDYHTHEEGNEDDVQE